MIHAVAFSFTFQCPAKCELCVTSSSPSMRGRLTLDSICRYLDSIKEVKGIEWVTLTGGEPLLFFDEVRTALSLARDRGLKTKIVTNAFWAVDEATAADRLAELLDSGLNFIGVSADMYHEIYVPLERVKYCISAAHKLGLANELAMVIGQNGIDSTVRILRRLDLETNGILMANKLKALDTISYLKALEGRTAVVLMPAQPFGRGTAHRDKTLAVPADTFKGVVCPMIGRVLAVGPEGDAYWCCCMFGYGGVRNECFRAGNLNQTAVAEIDAELDRDPLVSFLAYQGPWNMLKRLKERGAALPDRYTCPCDLCLTLFLSFSRTELERIARQEAGITEVMRWISNYGRRMRL